MQAEFKAPYLIREECIAHERTATELFAVGTVADIEGEWLAGDFELDTLAQTGPLRLHGSYLSKLLLVCRPAFRFTQTGGY